MPPPKKRRCYRTAEDVQSQSETQDEVDETTDQADSSSSSTSSSTSSTSSLSILSSSSSPLFYPPPSSSSEEEYADFWELTHPETPPSFCSSFFTAMYSPPHSPSDEGSCKQSEEGPAPAQDLQCLVPLPPSESNAQICNLVQFLLLKYRMREPTTQAEILNSVLSSYQDYYPVIFSEASECMQLVFGIEVKEVEPCDHTFVLVPALNLTYDGMVSNIQGIPKTGLLIMALCIIFKEGNCASEEVLWTVLNSIGLYADRYDTIYGYTRRLLIKDFVQEGYLEYRQVSHSDPPCYEFLWGPRAHAETSKMKILEFLYNIYSSDPSSCTMQPAEALRDEEEKAKAKANVAPPDEGSAMHSASSSAQAASSEDKVRQGFQ